jgi:hypothetical protein
MKAFGPAYRTGASERWTRAVMGVESRNIVEDDDVRKVPVHALAAALESRHPTLGIGEAAPFWYEVSTTGMVDNDRFGPT